MTVRPMFADDIREVPKLSPFSFSSEREMELWCLALKCSEQELWETARRGRFSLDSIESQLCFKRMLTRI